MRKRPCAVAPAQRLEQPGAGAVHRDRLEPALRRQRVDDDDLGAVRLVEPAGDRLGDAARGEILALGIDEAPRRGDQVEVEPLDLADRLGLGSIRAASARCATSTSWNCGASSSGQQSLPPLIGASAAPPATLPAVARQFAEARRRRGLRARWWHRARADRAAPFGRAAARLVVAVLARVPAVAGHVDAAAEGEAVVDHDDLLVVRGGRRMGAVEPGVDARVPHPCAAR